MNSPLISPRLARCFLTCLAATFTICAVLVEVQGRFGVFGATVAKAAAIGCVFLIAPLFVAFRYLLDSVEISTQHFKFKPDQHLSDILRPLVADLPYDLTIRVYESNEVNAFAISSVFGRHALIAFSSRMLKVSRREHLLAFAAHEVAHLKNGDSRNKAFILAFHEALQTYPRLASEIARVVLKQAVPAIALLFGFAVIVILFFAGPSGAAHAAAPLLLALARYVAAAVAVIGGFHLIERSMAKAYFTYSRAREFEADAGAAAMTSAADLASALKLLNAPDARVGVFDSHPPVAERISRLLS